MRSLRTIARRPVAATANSGAVAAQQPGRLHVCVVTEGSYPYVVGGTGEWTQRLMQTLPDVDFSIAAISASRKQPSDRHYEPPPNLRQIVDIALDDTTLLTATMKRRPRSARETRRIWELVGHGYRRLMRNDFSQFGELYGAIRHELTAWDLFHSPEHWDLVEHYYRLLAPIEPFIDFYWTWRFTHVTLYRLALQPLPPADIYHPIASGYAGFTALCAKLARGGKMVLTEHGLYTRERELEIATSRLFRGYQKDFLTGLFDKINRLVYHHADLIVGLFEEARQAQIGLGAPEARTEVISNGVDLSRFLSLPTRTSDEITRIGLVGRVVPVKDVRAFIECAKIVAETIPNAEFHIIGPIDEDPEYYTSCRQLIRQLQLEDRVQFTGYRAVEEYLPTLDIVMLTSLKEAQPFSVLEAMACGIPVVATRTGSVPEILEGVGYMAWPRDVQGFADAVIQLARDRALRRHLGTLARERIRERYDQRSNLERYRDRYRALAGWPASQAPTVEPAPSSESA